MTLPFANPFFMMALAAALLASIASGIVGAYIISRRQSFLTGSISHAILGGMGIALFLQKSVGIPWVGPIGGALVAGLFAAWLMGWVQSRSWVREDSMIAAIWAFGMAVGVTFIQFVPGSTPDLLAYLFGNILWATPRELIILGGLDILIALLAFVFHQRFVALCFDPQKAALAGQKNRPLAILLLTMMAISVVMLIQVIGSILVIALLTLPAAIAARYAKSLGNLIFIAILFAAAFSSAGLFAAFFLNLPPGATIALFSTATYLALSFKGQRA